MKATWLRMLFITLVAAGAAGGSGACTHTNKVTPDPRAAPAFPLVPGTYDCAAPATWTTTSFAALVPAVERASVDANADGALNGLLSSHHAEEVTCVVGYVHDQSVDQNNTATDKALPAKRVATTTAWIDQQSSKGLIVTNYRGEAN